MNDAKPASAIGYSVVINLDGNRQVTAQCFVAEDEEDSAINFKFDRVFAILDRQKARYDIVNERDELGDELVPDYMTSVKDGAFYGWPYSYFGQNIDTRVKPQRPDLVAKAIAPDYALGAHTASLGLAFYDGKLFPASYQGGAFIGQHGSWNRKPHSGYKVIFVPFADGRPSGPPQDFLTGFLDGEVAHGRPVGVAVDRAGALLVADDVGNIVWRVAPAGR